MTTYQIAFLFCRVVGTYFLWNALLSIVSGARYFFGISSIGYFGGAFFVSLVLGLAVRASAPLLASFIANQGAFEGESLSLDWTRTPHYLSLQKTLVGTLLLTFGVLNFSSSVLSFVAIYFSDSSFFSRNSIWITQVLGYVLPTTVQVIVGALFFFTGASAFRKLSATPSAPHSDSSQPL